MKEFKGYGIRVSNAILQNKELVQELSQQFYLINSIPNIFIIDKQSCSGEIYSLHGNWLVEVQHPSITNDVLDERSVGYVDALQDYLVSYDPSTNLIIYGYFMGN